MKTTLIKEQQNDSIPTHYNTTYMNNVHALLGQDLKTHSRDYYITYLEEMMGKEELKQDLQSKANVEYYSLLHSLLKYSPIYRSKQQ